MIEQVYNLFDPHKVRQTAEETVALTPDQALIKQIQGYRVVNLTERHGITAEQWRKGRDSLLVRNVGRLE